jgi:hypothetical protein
MLDEVSRFWNEHILADVPPDPINVDDVLSRYPRHAEGLAMEATPEMVAVHAELKELRERKKQLDDRETELTDAVKIAMRDCERIETGTGALFTWKASKDSTVFDMDRFKSENPELHQKYLIEKPGSRRFLIK